MWCSVAPENPVEEEEWGEIKSEMQKDHTEFIFFLKEMCCSLAGAAKALEWMGFTLRFRASPENFDNTDKENKKFI